MIELIFTIIILGFIATGLPMIMATDMDAREDGLVQEAIYAATAKMSQILSYKWDEASNEDNNTISGSRVLDIPFNISSDPDFRRNGTSKLRRGHFEETGRRAMYSNINERNASLLGSDAGDSDDIDDFIINENLVSGAASADTYKQAYTINVNVTYIRDTSVSPLGYQSSQQNNFEFENPTADITNIKGIVIDVLDTNNQRLFTLRTYSSNIGESSVSSRVFN